MCKSCRTCFIACFILLVIAPLVASGADLATTTITMTTIIANEFPTAINVVVVLVAIRFSNP